MGKRRTNRRDGAGRREERGPQKVRLLLDIMDRISTLTPREIAEMPYQTVREVMLFLGIDPDEPLPDDIVRLIDKLQSEKRNRPELRLVVNDDVPDMKHGLRLLDPEDRDLESGRNNGILREESLTGKPTSSRLAVGAIGESGGVPRETERGRLRQTTP